MVRLKLGKLQERWQYVFPLTLTQSVASPQGFQEFSAVIKDIKINPPSKAEDFSQVLDKFITKAVPM